MAYDGYPCLRVEVRDGVAWVTIDHPPINLFDMALIGDMLRVGEALEKDDAVLQGNDTLYGLAAGVWTRDVQKAHRVARAIRAGTVWVNCYNVLDPVSPFGGYKQSGYGRELGRASIDLYTQLKSVWMRV